MKNFFFIILMFNFLVSCQSTKDALTLQKKNNTDEFLIEKKSPLVLPPNFNELPVPNSKKFDTENDLSKNNDDVENIVNKNKSLSNKIESDSKTSSVEKSILEKIE